MNLVVLNEENSKKVTEIKTKSGLSEQEVIKRLLYLYEALQDDGK